MALSAEVTLDAIRSLLFTGTAQATLIGSPAIGRPAPIASSSAHGGLAQEVTLQGIYNLLSSGAALVTPVGF